MILRRFSLTFESQFFELSDEFRFSEQLKSSVFIFFTITGYIVRVRLDFSEFCEGVFSMMHSEDRLANYLFFRLRSQSALSLRSCCNMNFSDIHCIENDLILHPESCKARTRSHQPSQVAHVTRGCPEEKIKFVYSALRWLRRGSGGSSVAGSEASFIQRGKVLQQCG
jgi:hypothetical protein